MPPMYLVLISLLISWLPMADAAVLPASDAAGGGTGLVFILADQPFSEKPPGRFMVSQVKKDKYLLYIPATSDDLVSFTIVAPRSGHYRATTRLFNQQDPGKARLIVNEFADGPALPLAGTLQHGNVELRAGPNIVTYQLSGTAPKTKVRLWELAFAPVLPDAPAAPAAGSPAGQP